VNFPDAEPPSTLEPDRKPVARWRWWIHLVLIGSYPVALGLLGMNRYATRGPALTHSVRGLLITCGIQLAIFAIIFAVGWAASRASREDLLMRWRPGAWVVPLGFGYSIALRLGVALVAAILFGILIATRVVSLEQAQSFARDNRPDVTALVDMPSMRHNPAYFWLTVTFVSFVVAGLREELWRSAVLAGLTKLWPPVFGSRPGQVASVAVVSVAFGLGHLSLGPTGVASATLLGFGLGLIMILHRSIWPAVIAHGMFDATTFALLPWAMEQLQKA
jgi:membrane protease YdiL (CAAX protease family)